MLGVKLFNFSPGFQIYHWNLNTYILEKKFIKSIRNKAGPQTENVENQKVNTDYFLFEFVKSDQTVDYFGKNRQIINYLPT